jgi:DNA-binding MarR family transcriptional regulator
MIQGVPRRQVEPAAVPAVGAPAPGQNTPATPESEPGDRARTETATRVLRRFRLVFNAVKTHFQQVEKSAGIGGAQLWALSVVRAQPGIGTGALARAMDVHQTTASNLVKALVEQGLVESHRSGVDRRASQLKITRAGARVLARAPGPFTGVLPQALARLDDASLRRLDGDLASLLAVLQTDERAARIPLAEM